MQQRPSLKTHGAGWAHAAVATAAAAVGAAESAGRGHGLAAAAPAARTRRVVVWLLAWFFEQRFASGREELWGAVGKRHVSPRNASQCKNKTDGLDPSNE